VQRFNRGMLFNVGAHILLSSLSGAGARAGEVGQNGRPEHWSLILHDLDLLPSAALAPWYSFPPQLVQAPPPQCSEPAPTKQDTPTPRCASGACVHIAWRLLDGSGLGPLYPQCLGGVTSMGADAFVKVNGFPNGFWGWGGEDDALRRRCEEVELQVVRPAGRGLVLDLETEMLTSTKSLLATMKQSPSSTALGRGSDPNSGLQCPVARRRQLHYEHDHQLRPRQGGEVGREGAAEASESNSLEYVEVEGAWQSDGLSNLRQRGAIDMSLELGREQENGLFEYSVQEWEQLRASPASGVAVWKVRVDLHAPCELEVESVGNAEAALPVNWRMPPPRVRCHLAAHPAQPAGSMVRCMPPWVPRSQSCTWMR
jgi:hypothetical protein